MFLYVIINHIVRSKTIQRHCLKALLKTEFDADMLLHVILFCFIHVWCMLQYNLLFCIALYKYTPYMTIHIACANRPRCTVRHATMLCCRLQPKLGKLLLICRCVAGVAMRKWKPPDWNTRRTKQELDSRFAIRESQRRPPPHRTITPASRVISTDPRRLFPVAGPRIDS